jgi:hypothetical protein
MENLQKQIDNLQAQLDQLKRSNSIPREIETAFAERLGSMQASGTGSATTQSVSVPSTPTNITVPAQPSGTLTVKVGSVTYNLLYQ